MKNVSFPDFNYSNERNETHLTRTLFRGNDLNSLPVTVDFSVGKKEMLISDVSTLTSHSLIELNTTDNIPVNVSIGGKNIATGRIVIDENNKIFIQII